MSAIAWWLRLGVGVALLALIAASVASAAMLAAYVTYARLSGRPELLDGIRNGPRPWRPGRP